MNLQEEDDEVVPEMEKEVGDSVKRVEPCVGEKEKHETTEQELRLERAHILKTLSETRWRINLPCPSKLEVSIF